MSAADVPGFVTADCFGAAAPPARVLTAGVGNPAELPEVADLTTSSARGTREGSIVVENGGERRLKRCFYV